MRLVLSLFLCGTLWCKEAIYFMPEEQKQALEALKKSLASAQKEIQISIYSFTNKELAKVLRNQARNGVQIKIIYDAETNIKNSHSTIGYLGALKNIQVCLLKGKKAAQKDYYGLMHQKMALIDQKQIIFGSANWSKGAFENNYEILYLSDSKHLISKARIAFSKMLEKCRPY